MEDVEALREDTAAAGEAERRVRELLAESLSAEDDAAALQELAALEDAEHAAEAARLPAVPARAPVRTREAAVRKPRCRGTPACQSAGACMLVLQSPPAPSCCLRGVSHFEHRVEHCLLKCTRRSA